MIDYTKIKYTREWFDNPENKAHTIQDIKRFNYKKCKNIIQIGEHFLVDLYEVNDNGKNRDLTDVEIWEVENISKEIYHKRRGVKLSFNAIRKITTGKQFGYPNGYWKVKEDKTLKKESKR